MSERLTPLFPNKKSDASRAAFLVFFWLFFPVSESRDIGRFLNAFDF